MAGAADFEAGFEAAVAVALPGAEAETAAFLPLVAAGAGAAVASFAICRASRPLRRAALFL